MDHPDDVGKFMPFGKCVFDPHLCGGPCVSGQVPLTEILEALEAPGGTSSFSILCSRRVRRCVWSAALSRDVIRIRSVRRGVDKEKLEVRIQRGKRVQSDAVSLHREIYDKEIDFAGRLLGWKVARVRDYEQATLSRAYDLRKRYSFSAAERYLLRRWPFGHRVGESEVNYVARMRSLRWEDTPTGPEFSVIVPRTFGSAGAEHVEARGCS